MATHARDGESYTKGMTMTVMDKMNMRHRKGKSGKNKNKKLK